MAAPTASTILSDGMLERFRARAPGYDRENRFFQEDFDELREAGYLAIAVPRELGGRGFTFAECMREQRRLAYHAHATALAMNMHTYWVGCCRGSVARGRPVPRVDAPGRHQRRRVCGRPRRAGK